MIFDKFKKNEEEKYDKLREKHSKDFLELKKEALNQIDKCEKSLIVMTENGALVGGLGMDINITLTTFFANVISEGTFTKEELLTCVKLGELVSSGKLEKFNDDFDAIMKAMEE